MERNGRKWTQCDVVQLLNGMDDDKFSVVNETTSETPADSGSEDDNNLADNEQDTVGKFVTAAVLSEEDQRKVDASMGYILKCIKESVNVVDLQQNDALNTMVGYIEHICPDRHKHILKWIRQRTRALMKKHRR